MLGELPREDFLKADRPHRRVAWTGSRPRLLAFSHVEVTWQLGPTTVYGTVERPDGAGPFPGVVFVAGSGPTDRT